MLCAFLLALSAVVTTPAPSPQPPKGERPPATAKGEQYENLSADGKRSTNGKEPPGHTTPLVYQQDTTYFKTATNDSGEKIGWTRYLPWITAGANALIAIGTLVLAYATFRLVGRTTQQVGLVEDYTRSTDEMARATRDMAEAAKKSADVAETTLKGLERPNLFAELIEPLPSIDNFQEWLTNPTTFNTPHVDYCLRNYGRGPAIARSRKDRFARFARLPAEPGFDEEIVPGHTFGDPVEYAIIAPGGTSEPLRVMFTGRRNDFVWGSIKGAGDYPVGLYVYGTVVYEDILGITHESGFCFGLICRPDGKVSAYPAPGDAYHKHT